MPQYHGCIKLLKCPMKQAAANIVMRKKQHLMTKVSRIIYTNFFISQINSLSNDLKDKAQQMHIIIYKRTTMAKTNHLINSWQGSPSILFGWNLVGSVSISSNVVCSQSQIIKLKNVLIYGDKLATKSKTDHRDINLPCRIENHKYKAQSHPSHQSEKYAPV